jgi:hypothetical protein
MSHLADVAHQPLRRGVYRVEDHELRNSRTSCHRQKCLFYAQLFYVPAPKTLAVLDSLLYSFADELVPAAACATFATASDGDGVILDVLYGGKNEDSAGERGNSSARQMGYREGKNGAGDKCPTEAHQKKVVGEASAMSGSRTPPPRSHY